MFSPQTNSWCLWKYPEFSGTFLERPNQPSVPRITCRLCLLLLLTFIRCGLSLVEQPSSTLMLWFPYFMWLRKTISLFWPWLVTRLLATQLFGDHFHKYDANAAVAQYSTGSKKKHWWHLCTKSYGKLWPSKFEAYSVLWKLAGCPEP